MKYKNNKIVYEVGDWVVRPEKYSGVSAMIFNDKAFQIAGIDEDFFLYPDDCGRDGLESIRPATQEEIDKALKNDKIMIGEYEVEIPTDKPANIIRVGCQIVDQQTALKICKKAGWINE